MYLKDTDAFRDLLYMTALRGDDSTGLCVVDQRFDTRVFKGVLPASQFINTKGFDRLSSTQNRVMLGHCRKATQGKVSYDNAHPFEFKEIVGVHNGTLSYQSKNALVDSHKFGTDSEAIFWSFEKVGLEETMEKLQGAWALVWYDKKYRRLCFLRNKERPLFYAFNKPNTRLFWASEVEMLHTALRRNGIDYDKVHAFPEDTMMSWEVPSGTDAFGEPERERLEGKGSDFFLRQNRPGQTGQGTTTTSNTSSSGTTNTTDNSSDKRSTIYDRATQGTAVKTLLHGNLCPPPEWTQDSNCGYMCDTRNKYISPKEAAEERRVEQGKILRAADTFVKNSDKNLPVLIAPDGSSISSLNIPHGRDCTCKRCLPLKTQTKTTTPYCDVFQDLEEELLVLAGESGHSPACVCHECVDKDRVYPGTNIKTNSGNVISLTKTRHRRPGQKFGHQITYVTEKGDKLKKKDFESLTEKGCNWCGDNIEWQEPVVFHGGKVYHIDHIDQDEVGEIIKQGGRICQ